MKSLIGAGTQAFIELAPGTVLCGLLKQIDPAQKSLNVENAASLEKMLTELMAAESGV
jgi:[acyl-carrier-protein] S-malonyltransferase